MKKMMRYFGPKILILSFLRDDDVIARVQNVSYFLKIAVRQAVRRE